MEDLILFNFIHLSILHFDVHVDMEESSKSETDGDEWKYLRTVDISFRKVLKTWCYVFGY